MNTYCMGQDVPIAKELPMSPDIQAIANASTTTKTAENPILKILREGPETLINWLGNNEIWINDTRISTTAGKLSYSKGVTQEEFFNLQKPQALNWWQSMPNYVRFGVPAVALFLLLRGKK